MAIKFRNLFSEDVDQVFSYKTKIEVIILDRYIGIPVRIIQVLAIIYFLVTVYFIIPLILIWNYFFFIIIKIDIYCW